MHYLQDIIYRLQYLERDVDGSSSGKCDLGERREAAFRAASQECHVGLIKQLPETKTNRIIISVKTTTVCLYLSYVSFICNKLHKFLSSLWYLQILLFFSRFLLIQYYANVPCAHFCSSFVTLLFFYVTLYTSFHKRTPSTRA